MLFTEYSISRRMLDRVCSLGWLPSLWGTGTDSGRPPLILDPPSSRRMAAGLLPITLMGLGVDISRGRIPTWSDSIEAALTGLHEDLGRVGPRRRTLLQRMVVWQECLLGALPMGHPTREIPIGLRDDCGRLPARQLGPALVVAPEGTELHGLLASLEVWSERSVEGPSVRLVDAGLLLVNLVHMQPLTSFNETIAHLAAIDHLARHRVNPGATLVAQRLWDPAGRFLTLLDEALWSGRMEPVAEAWLDALADEADHLARTMRERNLHGPSALNPAGLLNPRQQRAISLIKEFGRLTNREYRRFFQVSNKTAHQELRELVQQRVIRRVGFGRAVEYVP